MNELVTADPAFAASELLSRITAAGLPSMYTFERVSAWHGYDSSWNHHVGTVLPTGGCPLPNKPSPWGDYALPTPSFAGCTNDDRLCDVCVNRPAAGGSCPATW